MKRNELYAITAATVVVGFLGTSFWYVSGSDTGDQFAQCRVSSVAGGGAAIGGPFTLIDETGKTVTDADVFTRPSLVYFGYTFCPDVCPLDNVRNSEAVDLLDAMGYDVQPVFISIDPERDTPEVVGDFTDFLHPEMLGLTGSLEQVKAASQAYKTYFKKQDGDDEYYLVDHSTFTYLVMPEVGFVEFFRRDDTAEQMAETTACFVKNAG